VHHPGRRGLVVLAVFAAVLVPLSAAQGGAFSGDNGSVAFTCGANVCTNGAASPLLTGATDPSWSSDGSQIAYIDAASPYTKCVD
jgi:hypothetical protein